MSEEPTHHCDHCNKDIVPEVDDPCGSVSEAAARCPHCGASDLDYQHEFGLDEPWVKLLEKKKAS